MNKLLLFLFSIIFIISLIGFIAALNAQDLIDDDAVKGDKDAPVTIVEFSDYECPFCGRFYSDTYKQIDSEYIKTGKVKFVYRDFSLSFHPQAQKAAEAAECAGEQGKYYEMHNKLFESGVAGGVAGFKQYAKDLGLNTADFNECLDTGKMASEIQKDFNDGQNAGIQGTPGFIVNGQTISGAQPYSVFKQVIDAELEKGNNTKPPEPNPSKMQREPRRGNADAKVKIIGYMGYNEPFSKRLWETIDRLFEEFGEEDLSFEFRNFPFEFQENSYLAAQAGECVLSLSNEETFFQYGNILMNNPNNNDRVSLISDAISIGINDREIEKCLKEEVFLAEVKDDIKNGKNEGVQGVPTFFINGEKIEGAQSYNYFAEVVRSALGNDDGEVIIDEDNENEGPINTSTETQNDICVSGCKYNGVCLDFGQRLELNSVNSYCDINKEFKEQKKESEVCQNNYECSTNQCSSGKCIDLNKKLEETNSLIEKLLNFFRKIFGKK